MNESNIATLLNEIRSATGWSHTKIAAATSVSQPSISRLFNGQKDCLGSTLKAIVALHSEVVSKNHLKP